LVGHNGSGKTTILNLLPTIWNTKKIKGLFVTTNSPFIFDNEFDEYAFDIQNFKTKQPIK